MPKKKMHFILLLTSIFASIVFLSGCVEEVYVDELKRPDCTVRFMQADPSYGPVTFSVYGRFEEEDKVVATATVDYASVSGYFTIPAGARKVTIQGSGLNSTVTLTFTSYWQSTLTLRNGALSNLYERLNYSDEAYKLDDGAGEIGALRFRNLTDAAIKCALDDYYWGGSSPTASIAAGTNFGYTPLEKGEHFFEIFTSSADLAGIDINVEGNVRYTIVAFGTLANPTLQIFKDDGK